MGRVFADSNVLFPFSVMDLRLALSEDSDHDVIWTDDLLNEWERVIVREHKRSPKSAAQITNAVRGFFADSKVQRDEYEHLIEEMPGKDRDDHAHMAAAVARQPCTILTNNARDFPPGPLAERGRAGDRSRRLPVRDRPGVARRGHRHRGAACCREGETTEDAAGPGGRPRPRRGPTFR